jgi:hypothetical protein
MASLVGLIAVIGIILAVWKLPSILYGDVTNASPDARLQAASGFRTAIVAGIAGLAALLSLVVATRTYRLTQEGQITDRYTKAIEQLGSDKRDICLGAIYALVLQSQFGALLLVMAAASGGLMAASPHRPAERESWPIPR